MTLQSWVARSHADNDRSGRMLKRLEAISCKIIGKEPKRRILLFFLRS
jgi:hypothetical protein